MRIVLLGKGEMLANLIEGALAANAEIVGVLRYEKVFCSGVITNFKRLFVNSYPLTLIKKYNLNDLKFKSANNDNFKSFLIKNNVDVVLVGTWAEKIKKEIFEVPKIATINVHPSLLPKYRGPNPYLQSILNGETHSGITFHLMNENFDSGSILAQAKIKLYGEDTGYELRMRTVTTAKYLCAELLKDLGKGCVVPIPQNELDATYYPDVKPEDMTLDFRRETSEEILRHVRAFYPFRPVYIDDGHSFWIVNPYKVKIVEQFGEPSKIIKMSSNSLLIYAKDKRAIKFSGLKKYSRLFNFQ